MDFNVILDVANPYLATGGILGSIGLILGIVAHASKTINNINSVFSNTSKKIEGSVKKVIPQTLYVKVEGVAREEFAKMRAELEKSVDKRCMEEIRKNTELVQAMALAMTSMKAIPDSQKELLAKHLEIKPETTEALVIDLISTEEAETKKPAKILID